MRRAILLVFVLLGCQSNRGDCPSAPGVEPTATPPTPSPHSANVSERAAPAPAPASAAPEHAHAEGQGSAGTPSPLRAGNHVDSPPALDEVNRWATTAGVRDDLLLWVAQALPTRDTRADVSIEYASAEAPITAVATVTLDGYLDDSVRGERFVLKFSRKACADCPTGMSGWWLWDLDVTRRCRSGRGHETFDKTPCR